METFITDVAQVTPEWLTKILRDQGLLTTGEVIEVFAKQRRATSISRSAHLEVHYAPDAPAEAPRKFFLKLSVPEVKGPGLAEANRNEVEFYNTVAGMITGPPFIRCYKAAHSPELGASYLLLEDLSDSHFQTEAPSLPSTIFRDMTVDNLAHLHASMWGDGRLGIGLGDLFDERRFDSFLGETGSNINRFLNAYGAGFSVEWRKAYEHLLASLPKPWKHLTQLKNLTVIHGDSHWWNFLYPRDPRTETVRIIDWQLWHIDRGVRDLAFLIIFGSPTEERASIEQRLMRRYHEALISRGVDYYTWEECMRDYRWSAIRNLNVPVVQWSQGRNPNTWFELEKAMSAYNELECDSLLDN